MTMDTWGCVALRGRATLSRMAKRSQAKRIAVLVNEGEATAFLALEKRTEQVREKSGLRLVMELLPPAGVQAPGGDMRPGLVLFAEDGAGGGLAWDLRRPSDAPPVVYCDHELRTATPFARDVRGAFQHVLVMQLVGEKGDAFLELAGRVRASFELVPEVAAVFERLEKKARKSPRVAPLRNEEAAHEAVAFLVPEAARGGLAWIPVTHYPLLDPTDPACLDGALESYDEAIATYRELVHDEGREVFAWHLADTLKNASGVLVQRERFAEAEAAAREALLHYLAIYERGDTRVLNGLVFVHRILSVVEARNGNHQEAYAQAERALQLQERSLLDAYTMLQAYELLLSAWEEERAGKKARSRENLRFAAKKVAAFRDLDPPHAFRDVSARIARLADDD